MAAAFCRQQGINPFVFYRWNKEASIGPPQGGLFAGEYRPPVAGEPGGAVMDGGGSCHRSDFAAVAGGVAGGLGGYGLCF